MINENDLELQLLAGMNINIPEFITIYFPSIKEIISIGESTYNELLSYLLIDKDCFEQFKDQDVSNLELLMVFSYHDENYRKKVLTAFNLFFKKTPLISDDGVFYFKEKDKIFILDKVQFEDIQFVLKKANKIKIDKEPEYNPGNERARKFIEKMLKTKKNRPKQKSNLSLHSIISGLAWRSNGVSIFNIFNLTIYQLYDAFHRTENIDHCYYTLSGIYAGTVDSKKIDLKTINWAKTLEI